MARPASSTGPTAHDPSAIIMSDAFSAIMMAAALVHLEPMIDNRPRIAAHSAGRAWVIDRRGRLPAIGEKGRIRLGGGAGQIFRLDEPAHRGRRGKAAQELEALQMDASIPFGAEEIREDRGGRRRIGQPDLGK